MLSTRYRPLTSLLTNLQMRNASAHLKAFATIDAKNLSVANKGMNLVNGEWVGA
jgi:hypothetical protein